MNPVPVPVQVPVPVTPRSSRPHAPHLDRLPSTPRTAALVEITSRHALQRSTSLTISHFATLLAELNAAHELDRRTGREIDRVAKIELFRQDWMTGLFMRSALSRPLDDGESEAYSDGTRRSSLGAASSSPSLDAAATTTTTTIAQMPLDAVSRGVIAEERIKRQLARECVLVVHEDFESFARIARKAIRQTLRLDRPVYVSPGLLHSVDWTDEYRQRHWAAPGIRWGPFRPDLVKFERVKRVSDSQGDDQSDTEVSWEIIEVKYASKSRDVIYTNYKVQAIFYHLTLQRLLSTVPCLVPSHKVTFWISHDPLGPDFVEKSVSIRTEQAFVEHHLFHFLPQWLRAVTDDEWKRLQDRLAEKAPPTTGVSSSPGTPTFLDKLRASQRKLPPSGSPSGSQSRPYRAVPSTPLARSHTASTPSRPAHPPAPALSIIPIKSNAPTSPSTDSGHGADEEEEEEDSFASAPSSPLLTTRVVEKDRLGPLPPLPPVDDREEEELSASFDAALAIE